MQSARYSETSPYIKICPGIFYVGNECNSDEGLMENESNRNETIGMRAKRNQ
jgi:hypothetical protein